TPYLRRNSRPRLSITVSWLVITRRPLVISKDLRWGGRLFCLLTVLLPVSLGTLLWIASSVISVKHTDTAP
ncbi:unnamed protein product, partial [Staurois parvus]